MKILLLFQIKFLLINQTKNIVYQILSSKVLLIFIIWQLKLSSIYQMTTDKLTN